MGGAFLTNASSGPFKSAFWHFQVASANRAVGYCCAPPRLRRRLEMGGRQVSLARARGWPRLLPWRRLDRLLNAHLHRLLAVRWIQAGRLGSSLLSENPRTGRTWFYIAVTAVTRSLRCSQPRYTNSPGPWFAGLMHDIPGLRLTGDPHVMPSAQALLCGA
jgi:hypothetical protein